MVYLGGSLMATTVVFVAGHRIGEPGLPAGYRFLLSVAAGSIWPLLLIGAVEFTSMAVYSSAEHLAIVRGPNAPRSELDDQQTNGNVVSLR